MQNSWSKSDKSNEFDTISSFFSTTDENPEEEEEEFRSDFFEGLAGRNAQSGSGIDVNLGNLCFSTSFPGVIG